jgi:hypothetical protein
VGGPKCGGVEVWKCGGRRFAWLTYRGIGVSECRGKSSMGVRGYGRKSGMEVWKCGGRRFAWLTYRGIGVSEYRRKTRNAKPETWNSKPVARQRRAYQSVYVFTFIPTNYIFTHVSRYRGKTQNPKLKTRNSSRKLASFRLQSVASSYMIHLSFTLSL